MRKLTTLAAALLLTLAGCGNGEAQADALTGPEDPLERDWPASIPGGACLLLNYDKIEEATGVRFNVSATATVGQTNTCALTVRGSAHPDLILAVTPSQVDDASYRSTMVPAGSTATSKLGRVGYWSVAPAKAGTGPVAEAGWLSANGRLMSLTYTFPPDTGLDEAKVLGPKLADLGKQVDVEKPAGE